MKLMMTFCVFGHLVFPLYQPQIYLSVLEDQICLRHLILSEQMKEECMRSSWSACCCGISRRDKSTNARLDSWLLVEELRTRHRSLSNCIIIIRKIAQGLARSISIYRQADEWMTCQGGLEVGLPSLSVGLVRWCAWTWRIWLATTSACIRIRRKIR